MVSIRTEKEEEEVMRLNTSFDLDEMYREMLKDVLDGFLSNPPRAAIPLANGVAVLQLVSAALESSAAGRAISLNED